MFRGNKVLVGEDLKPATVVVEDGKITAVHDGLVDPGAGQEDIQDLGDDILMPGLVDCHVHINEPGRTDWEGEGHSNCTVHVDLFDSSACVIVFRTFAEFEFTPLHFKSNKYHSFCRASLSL